MKFAVYVRCSQNSYACKRLKFEWHWLRKKIQKKEKKQYQNHHFLLKKNLSIDLSWLNLTDIAKSKHFSIYYIYIFVKNDKKYSIEYKIYQF